MTFVTHFECSLTGAHHDADAIHGLAQDSNKPLLVRYDLDAIRTRVDRAHSNRDLATCSVGASSCRCVIPTAPSASVNPKYR